MNFKKHFFHFLTFRFTMVSLIIDFLSKIFAFLKLPGKDYLKALYELIAFCRYPLLKPTFYITRYAEYPLAISSLAINTNETVLDLGCGDSPLPLFLRFKDRKVLAVDAFKPFLLTLKKHELYETDDVKIVDKTVMDISLLGIKTESVDKIICVSVIEHLPHDLDIKCMLEIARVLKKGGLLFISFEIVDKESMEWHNHKENIGKVYFSELNESLNQMNSYKQFCRRYSFSSIDERLLASKQFIIKDGGYFNFPLFIRKIFDNEGVTFIKKYFDFLKPFLGLVFLVFRKSLKQKKHFFENAIWKDSSNVNNIIEGLNKVLGNNGVKSGSFAYLLLEKK